MNKKTAILKLKEWDKKGWYVFTYYDLRKIFSDEKRSTFISGLKRLIKDDILVKACRGIYVNPYALSLDGYTIEHIAKALRRGEYNYVSLESILSEYGVISQIPIDRITVMTTGRKGVYVTSYGTIEFTHTKRPAVIVREGIQQVKNRPLLIATKETAWRDLKRVGRNIDLVNREELNE